MLQKMIFSIQSPFPTETKEFYTQLGAPWQPIMIGHIRYDFFVVGDLFIVLSGHQHDKPSTNLYIYNSDNRLLNTIDDKGVILGGENSHLDTEEERKLLRLTDKKIKHMPTTTFDVVPVLRAPSIEQTTQKLKNLGQWMKEKHGAKGPAHYCLTKNELTLEIYPQRETSLSDNHWELVFTAGMEKVELGKLNVMSHSRTSTVILDPNGSIANILKPLE